MISARVLCSTERLVRETISHPYVSFFHLLVNGFSVTSFRSFTQTPTLIIAVGGVGGRGGIKMASAKTQSANEPTMTSV